MRGVRLVVPREEPHTGPVATTDQRPTVAFSIRQPRVDGARGGAEIAQATAAAVAVGRITSNRGREGSPADCQLRTADCEESDILRFDSRRETRLPERALATAPHVTAPHTEDLAATLASLLDDEADLRGAER